MIEDLVCSGEWSALCGMYRIDKNQVKGRHLVSCGAIEPGITIFDEKAFAQIVMHPFRREICAACFRRADPDLICDLCSKVAFCSEDCEESFQHIHAFECEPLEEVDRIAAQCTVDVDLLRLVLRILAVRSILAKGGNTLGITSTSEDLDNMIHALDQQDAAWKDSITESARMLVEYLPEDTIESRLFLELAGRINENCHALGSLEEPLNLSMVGMFPMMSLINHSCAPNCIWSITESGRIQIRSIEKIEPNQEITVSYMKLNLPRSIRQGKLMATKHFFCQCDRCNEPLETSEDRFLDAVYCSECDQVPCCHHSATEIDAFRERMNEKYDLADKYMETKQYDRATPLLQSFLEQNGTLSFHPNHYLVQEALFHYGTCCALAMDHVQAAWAWRLLSERMTSISIRHAVVLFNLGEALRLEAKRTGSSVLAEAKKTYEACLDMRTTAFGKQNPATIQVQQVLNNIDLK